MTSQWTSVSLSPLPVLLQHLFNATQKSKQKVHLLLTFFNVWIGYRVIFILVIIVIIMIILIIITRNALYCHAFPIWWFKLASATIINSILAAVFFQVNVVPLGHSICCLAIESEKEKTLRKTKIKVCKNKIYSRRNKEKAYKNENKISLHGINGPSYSHVHWCVTLWMCTQIVIVYTCICAHPYKWYLWNDWSVPI